MNPEDLVGKYFKSNRDNSIIVVRRIEEDDWIFCDILETGKWERKDDLENFSLSIAHFNGMNAEQYIELKGYSTKLYKVLNGGR